ncbi:MAG: DUF6314 family protein [Rickettsiaceae bacterium]|nr:DUF6314 family protein [Rickettsiaceae bacterium]
MKKAQQIFDFLPGKWSITRNFISLPQSLHKTHIALGHATFTASEDDSNLLLYSEKITMSDSIIGTQEYSYRYDEINHSLSKYFSDGRLFYIIDTSNGKASGYHLCIKDIYKSEYIFDNDQFSITYFITGPSKNCKIITKYTKT